MKKGTNLQLDPELVKKAQKIPVPEPGEIITIPLELLATWMKVHRRKTLRWQGSMLVTVPEGSKKEEKSET